MTSLVQRAEDDNRERVAKEDARKRQAIDNQLYLRNQMDTSQGSLTGSATRIVKRSKNTLGGMMNPEDAKMNRALLQEIARVKRGEATTQILEQ